MLETCTFVGTIMYWMCTGVGIVLMLSGVFCLLGLIIIYGVAKFVKVWEKSVVYHLTQHLESMCRIMAHKDKENYRRIVHHIRDRVIPGRYSKESVENLMGDLQKIKEEMSDK